jgi:hypothetical protein
MRTITLSLAGRSYTVYELSIKKNSAWRRKFLAATEPVLGFMQVVGLEINSMADLEPILNQVKTVLLDAPDTLLGLLFDYSPTLAKDRKFIEEHLYESELFDAFRQLLSVAFPITALLAALTPAAPTVSTNGAAPQPSMTTSPN